jgi:hypothetical protein
MSEGVKLHFALLVSSIDKISDLSSIFSTELETGDTAFSATFSDGEVTLSAAIQIHDIGSMGNKLAGQHCDGVLVYISNKDCLAVISAVLDAYSCLPLKIFISADGTVGSDIATVYNGKFLSDSANTNVNHVILEGYKELKLAI